MARRTFTLHRALDLPPAIVWDAFVDEVLVSGWLGEARIDPVVGGEVVLEWFGSPDFPGVRGVITALDEPETLAMSTDSQGDIGIRLVQVAGGSRGTSTELSLTIDLDIESAFEDRVRRNWETSLDQLSELLRGHPVDWTTMKPASRGQRDERGIGHN